MTSVCISNLVKYEENRPSEIQIYAFYLLWKLVSQDSHSLACSKFGEKLQRHLHHHSIE